MKVTLPLMALAFAAVPAFAATAPAVDNVFADLSLCDAKFFNSLGAKAREFSSTPYYRAHNSIGYFQVPNQRDQKLSVVRFQVPLRIGDFDIAGYFDETLFIGELGAMISWGFIVRAPIEVVVATTKPYIWENDRLRRDGAVYVRSELWSHAKTDGGWQKVETEGGKAPAPGTVERVLLIEPYEDDPSLTRFGCSLQGSVTRDMLRTSRPDLEAQESSR